MRSWLIDKSAISRLHLDPRAGEWAERIERGLVRICTVTLLEVGYSARSATERATPARSRTARVNCESIAYFELLAGAA